MEFDDIINAYFVTTEKGREHGKGEATKDMQRAFECLQAHLSEEHIRQIKASEGFPLIASGTLTKKDVFIFDNFAGAFFEQLQQTRSLIIGPRCLINCLQTETPIPQGTSPVYVVAMRDIKISASGLKAKEKEELRQLVHWMGGNYFQNFGRGITHLVSNTIKSTKYEHATLNGIPVMHPDWVQRVWERNRITDVAATDSEFDKYRLPIFYGINVSCTGLDATSRNEVMRLVNENGGTFHRAFRSQQVDIVITEKGSTNSEKYKAAVRYKKDILLPEWIFESVQKGFALPTKNYYVRNLKVSTPTKNEQAVPDFTLNSLADFSRISVASSKRDNETINDTASTNDTIMDNMPGTSKSLQREVLKKASTTERYRLVYEEICATEAKKAGTFLDGCCIYLSGFRAEEREKLNRILNVGGATRYDVVNEKITHIIVGQLDDNEFRTWQKAGYLNSIHVVRLNWLLESIKLKSTASENVYRVSLPSTREPDAPSPSSKRTLRSMNHSFKQPDLPIKRKLFLQNDVANKSPEAVSPPKRAPTPEANDVDQLIAQYTPKNNATTSLPTVVHDSTLMQPKATSTQYNMKLPPVANVQPNGSALNEQTELDTIDYEHLNFLQGMTVYLVEETFSDEFFMRIQYVCEAAQGSIVSDTYRDTVDYAVVCCEQAFDASSLPVKVRHIVTELYLEDCLKQNRLIPIEYYHKHIPHTSAVQPLKNMTIVISLYSNFEKDFLETLAQLLGANVNNQYVKKEKPLLVCQTAKGSKYEGALKWRFPIVHAEYLVQCAEQGKKLPFADHLVGESVDDFPFTASTTECSTPEITPLRNKRVSELAGNSFMQQQQNLGSDSPHTPLNSVGRGRYNFEVMEKIADEFEDAALRQNLKELINEMRKEQTPELERLRRQAYTPENRNVPTPKGIPEFCTTPAFEKRMEDAFERLFKLPITKLKPDTPVPEILRRAIIETCKSFGIPVDNENQPPSTSKAVNKPASTANTPLFQKSVAPRAIFAETAKEPVPETQNNTRVAERSGRESDAFVPDTQSPNHSQSMLMQRASLGKSSINFDKINFEDTSQASKQSIVSNTSSPELLKISEYLKNSGRGSITKEQPTKASGVGIQDTQEGFVGPFLSEKFSVGTQEMVVWKDRSISDKNLETDENKRNDIKYFSLSCDPEKLDDLIQKIKGLGGVVSDNLTNFDPKSTHFVCERPNRGEKMMGSIASGKWVLTMNYIEHSYAKGMFLEEELYEWGNATTLEIPAITADEQTIVNAAHRWRKKLLNEHGKGAFTGMKAILRIGPRTYDPLKNVLQAGGAEVIEARSPYGVHNNAHQCSHCFVDIKKFPLQPADYRFLKKHNIIVVTQMYINAFLMKVGDVEMEAFEVKM